MPWRRKAIASRASMSVATSAAVLQELRPDVVFNALHGPFGEDGTIQGISEYLEIPIPIRASWLLHWPWIKTRQSMSPRLPASRLPEALVMDRRSFGNQHPMKPPYVVKPVREGSSFGVVIVKGGSVASAFSDHLKRVGGTATASWCERYIAGREFTCGVMGDVALGVTEIIPQGHAFYDYDSKYVKGGSKHVIPAQISPNIYQKIQTLALKAHEAIGCRGVSRSDFRFDDRGDGEGELIWLEINTQPGMTPTSLVPEMAQHAGLQFGEFLRWMVEDASCLR